MPRAHDEIEIEIETETETETETEAETETEKWPASLFPHCSLLFHKVVC